MNSTESQALFNVPTYWPSKGAAFAVASLYYALGIALLVESKLSRRYRYMHLTVLISWMLGGAFTARGVFVVQEARSNDPFIAFSVLSSVAPNLINLVNYLLLINLMRGLHVGPSKGKLVLLRAFAATAAIAFGAVSAAGAALLSGDPLSGKYLTGYKLYKASTAGQMATSLLFVLIATGLTMAYKEALALREWVAMIFVGGLFMVARNITRMIVVFDLSDSLIRDSEAAYYCLDPLFTLIIISTWAVLNLPRRCHHEAKTVSL
ncbi:hypothetical protein GGI21_000990 [Coemansia aciculifera]|uniref:Uncharacterized protein n=1 Tax=Coemansia aciculifera TaxID=417176 RepID=A0ACC1LVC2_9FUNG|nr:hypothetical protein IWW38_005542 [Coemansia aciculifera]KAJ2910326.1 hypothetical protein GGI21_000990 [Coemansia aciculifera]